MMGKVETLTLAQEEALRAFHADWYRYGTLCEPSDRVATERAITRMYEIVGKPAPQFVWCASPATGALAVALLSGKLGGAAATAGGSLGGSLWDSLGDSLWGSLGDSLGGSLRGSLWDSLRGSLWDSLGDSLGGSLRDSLGDSLRDSLGETISYQAFWGQHEAYWIAYYLFPENQQLVTYDPKRSEQLGLWAEISRSTGWWFPYENVVVCTERPIRLEQETVTSSWPYGVTSRRLHSEKGAALEYGDGWAVHAWHGTRVPAWVVEDPTVELAMKEPNSEIRRAAFESIGWDKAIPELDMKELGRVADPGNAPHDLALYKMPPKLSNELYGRQVNLLLMTNGSPDRDGSLRQYAETVPAEITNPIEAAAWQYEVDPMVYAQIARRT